SRHPDRAVMFFPDAGRQLRSVHGDTNEDKSVTAAIEGAFAVVNAVSLYVERGRDTFQSVHINAAERVARLACETGVERLLHISGIGADAPVNVALHPQPRARRSGRTKGISLRYGAPSSRDVRTRRCV